MVRERNFDCSSCVLTSPQQQIWRKFSYIRFHTAPQAIFQMILVRMQTLFGNHNVIGSGSGVISVPVSG